MSSKNYEGSGYGLNMESITILYKLHVSYPRRSGLGRKNCLFKTNLPYYLEDCIIVQLHLYVMSSTPLSLTHMILHHQYQHHI